MRALLRFAIALLVCASCKGTTTGANNGGDADGSTKPPESARDAGGGRSQGGEAGRAGGGSGAAGSSARRDGGVVAAGNGGDSGNSGSGQSGGSGGGQAGSGGAGGAGNGGGGGSGGGAPAPSASGLPVAPGAGDRAEPSAAGAPNLKVLPWAGFKAAASYTFDDSQPSHVAHFAEIKAAGVPVTWYLNNSNNWIADYDATWKQALAAGHELGNHTVHHCNADLGNCTGALASADLEIDACSDYITGTLGGPAVRTIAYPFGDTAWAAKSKARFLLARGTSSGTIGFDDATDPFNLPCVAAAGGEGEGAFSSAIDGARSGGAWVIFLFHSLLPTSDNWYAGVDVASVTGSIAHGKSLGDVWIDTVANVGAYWLGARALRTATATASGGGMSWSWSLPDHFPSGAHVRVTVDGGQLSQGGKPLAWDGHGYYEVALDARELSWSP